MPCAIFYYLLETLAYLIVVFDLLPLCSHPSHFIDPFPRPGQLIYMRAEAANVEIHGGLLRSHEGALMHYPKQRSGSIASYCSTTMFTILLCSDSRRQRNDIDSLSLSCNVNNLSKNT